MEKKLRKYRNTLVVSGTGVVLFGAWSIVKTLMYFTMAPVFAQALMEFSMDDGVTEALVLKIFWFLIGFVLVIELSVRAYIGLSAVAEGKGKKKGYVYVLLAVWLWIQQLVFLVQGLATAQYVTDSLLDTAVTLIVDLTSMYTMMEMIVSSVRVKWHRKALS